MKKIDDIYFINPEQYIPNSFYCHGDFYNEEKKTWDYICPFWDYDKTKSEQENGYCHLIKKGDWDFEYMGLLWDKCKECGINDDDFEN